MPIDEDWNKLHPVTRTRPLDADSTDWKGFLHNYRKKGYRDFRLQNVLIWTATDAVNNLEKLFPYHVEFENSPIVRKAVMETLKTIFKMGKCKGWTVFGYETTHDPYKIPQSRHLTGVLMFSHERDYVAFRLAE